MVTQINFKGLICDPLQTYINKFFKGNIVAFIIILIVKKYCSLKILLKTLL